jgi:hypothetical protein
MSEKLSALIYILTISFLGFSLSKFITKDIIAPKEFAVWRKAWFLMTIAAFAIPNFWMFIVTSIFLIYYLSKSTEDKVALYFILLFSVPYINLEIPGVGSINYFFTCNFPRVLSLFLLVPEAIRIAKSNRDFGFGKIWTDRWMLIYGSIWFILVTLSYGVTSGVRLGLYTFLQLGIPYYVISRGIKTLEQMKTALFAFVSVSLVLSLIGIFENKKNWLVYNSLFDQFGAPHAFTNYIMRGSELRAVATFDLPIILGFFLVVAIGLYLFIYPDIKNKLLQLIGGGILFVGILAPISRGPWVGLAVFAGMYAMLGKNKLKKIGIFIPTALALIILLNYLPNGQKYLDLIPFVGTTDAENVTYRQRLFENSMIVISHQPFFGSQGTLDFRNEPEMVELRQGQGIVDIVNTYLLEALQSGCISLFCFVMIYLSAMTRIWSYKNRIKKISSELEQFGNVVLAILISILVMIATVSSIEHIPYIINIVLALGIAYTRIAAQALNELKSNLGI